MDEEKLILRRTRFNDNLQVLADPSENGNNRNVNIENAITNPDINFSPPLRNFHSGFSREAKNAEKCSDLVKLTEEFNDLTRKMNLLKEALGCPVSGCNAKKLGARLINASSEALQIANLCNIIAVKRFVRDCIAELTSIDHFLDGKEEQAAQRHGELRKEFSINGGTVLIQRPPSAEQDTFQLNPPDGSKAIDVSTEISESLSNMDKKDVEVQADTTDNVTHHEISGHKEVNDSTVA